MNIELLGKKIEEAYNELTTTVEKLNTLTGIVDQLKNNTKGIIDQYVATLDPTKMAEMRESSKKAFQQMMDDIIKIDQALKNYEVVEYQLGENITGFNVRLNQFENSLQSTRKSLQDMDTKLLKLIKEAEKNQANGQKRFQQASQLFHASAEIEKYDELIKLERENNRLLKELLGKKDQIGNKVIPNVLPQESPVKKFEKNDRRNDKKIITTDS